MLKCAKEKFIEVMEEGIVCKASPVYILLLFFHEIYAKITPKKNEQAEKRTRL